MLLTLKAQEGLSETGNNLYRGGQSLDSIGESIPVIPWIIYDVLTDTKTAWEFLRLILILILSGTAAAIVTNLLTAGQDIRWIT